jgi:hypothetical protein
MNNSEIEFSVHDGDLKAGSGTAGSATPTDCSNALYTQAIGYFNSLKKPAAVTPGDNDWTDCDRTSNGLYNSLERLQHERDVLFSTDHSFGKETLRQTVQTSPACEGWDYATSSATTTGACVENRIWTFQKVTYVTVNIQGTCNNLCGSGSVSDPAPGDSGDANEYAARNAADNAWLQAGFAEAIAKNSAGIMVIGQADPGFDGSDGTRAPLRNPKTLDETDANSAPKDGYKSFLTTLRQLTVDFKRPVVYVHGDSHYFRVDKPLQDASAKQVENFTRVETFGDKQGNGNNAVHWVKALVDPNSRDVFAFQAQMVSANRIAVPSP